jgi:hypothetical protein
MTAPWTTPAEVRARVRRRWDDGTLLRSYAARDPFPVIEIPLRGPRIAEIEAHLGAVQEWISSLGAGRRGGNHYALERAPVGGRLIGRNEIPRRAIVSTYSQAWELLAVGKEVRRFDDILTTVDPEPVIRDWVAAHPLKAIALHPDWPKLLTAYRWLEDHRGSSRYLREIDAPGVDTKFVERHRNVLASLLGVSASSPAFLTELGMSAKPELLRLRLDPSLGLFSSLTDITVRSDELRDAQIALRTAVIVENEITFLSLPVPEGGVVLWGKGFEVGRAGSLPWLRGTDVHYWGDLDTHGFAILNQLRVWLPHTRSFLMDRETLLAHEDRWGAEHAPTRARLDHLDAEERALYEDLVGDRLGERVRLEQERINWSWAEQRFPFA